MRHVKRITLLLILLAAGVSVLAASAQTPQILRLGMLAAADSPAGRGAQLALAQINGSGGITGPDGTVYGFELLSVPVQTPDEIRAGLQALGEREVMAILGPDGTAETLAIFNDLRALGLPVLTAATGDSITIADTSDYIFRSRAPEQVDTLAIAKYLAENLDSPRIAIVQADSAASVSESIGTFTSGLSQNAIAVQSPLQVQDPETLEPTVVSLENLNPDVIAVWGPPGVAVELLAQLRDAGWDGLYFYREATGLPFREALLARNGLITAGPVLGVTSWSPGVRSTDSDAFLRDYVTTFGSVPDDLSAAYFDAVYLLAAAVREAGGAPADIKQALQTLPSQNGVQGTFQPGAFFVGETIDVGVVVQLNAYAAPQVQALLEGGELTSAVNIPEGGLPTPTPPPSPIVATPTPNLTATPQGVWGTVASARLNVRTGPGTSYDVIGQLNGGDSIFPIGANVDFTWLVIPFRGQTGWVATYLVEILGGSLNTLPIVIPPPSPTPAATLTPTVPPFADLVVAQVTLEPLRPASGTPFTVRTVIQNIGVQPSGETALAATFQPGNVYASAPIPALAPGQSVQVVLTPTLTGSGAYTVMLVVDLNNLVNEGPVGESNNNYPITYTFDKAPVMLRQFSMDPGTVSDLLVAAVPVLSWDGTTLSAINGAQIAIVPGLDFDTAYYDQVPIVSGSAVAGANLVTGVNVGILLPSGQRGLLHIVQNNGISLNILYRIWEL